MSRVIVHADMDAFFASVEQRGRPELRGKPVIVGGDPAGRSVVAAASYEARAFGVHSAMPCSQARRLCPDAIFVPPNGSSYGAASTRIMAIFGEVTPLVEQVSVDEAFLDLTGTERLLGDPIDTARRLKSEVREREGLTVSMGIGPSKLVAKLATDAGKPDGFVVVPEDGVRQFLDPMPIDRLLGVGAKTAERLRRLGLTTIGALARASEDAMAAHFGPAAAGLVSLARGEDDRPVTPQHDPKSMSAETTFERDLDDPAALERCLLGLADTVARRLRKSGLRARTVELKVRFSDFHTILRSVSPGRSFASGSTIYRMARDLMERVGIGARKVRLIGVGASNLTEGEEWEQLSLFTDPGGERAARVERAMDEISEKFGRGSVTRATLLEDD
jgi:nucleotidyltransferase/DNA polymerase involved in DNA repair